MKTRRVVIIGHAVHDERGGTDSDGKSKLGNQGGELIFQEWYRRSKGYKYVFRAKDRETRIKIAQNAAKTVLNPNVGYTQSYKRTSLYREAGNHNWDISKIDTPCGTDCSAMVAAVSTASGIRVSKDMYTGNEYDELMRTDEYDVFTDSKYTDSPDLLEPGDILLGPGHTCIITDVTVKCILERNLKYVQNNLMRGDDVKQLQKILKDLGYAVGTIDGIFGPMTDKAVKQYQKDRGLGRDGIVGPKTAKSLGFEYEKG